MWRQRKVASSVSGSAQMSVPSSNNLPSVGGVSAPSIANRVDLPEPERPTIETNSLARNSRQAPRTASYPGAAPYLLVSNCADRITAARFCLNERMGRHLTRPPCRHRGADQTEHSRKGNRHGRAD